MSRPLRIEFPAAVYHVTSRGDRREPIYRDDEDRVAQLEVIALAMDRFDAQVLAYCQMGRLATAPRAVEVPMLQRKRQGTFQDYLNHSGDRAQALRLALREHGITMTSVAQALGLSVSRVSRMIAMAKREAIGGGRTVGGKI